MKNGFRANVSYYLKTYKNKLSVPSALVYGEKTDVLPVSYFNRFAKMNDIPLTKIANGGHMFPLEQPEETAEIIRKIIKDWYADILR